MRKELKFSAENSDKNYKTTLLDDTYINILYFSETNKAWFFKMKIGKAPFLSPSIRRLFALVIVFNTGAGECFIRAYVLDSSQLDNIDEHDKQVVQSSSGIKSIVHRPFLFILQMDHFRPQVTLIDVENLPVPVLIKTKYNDLFIKLINRA